MDEFDCVVAVGSRDFRNITAGFGYRFDNILIDYAFVMPVGGPSGLLGNHQIGLTFRFGKPILEEDLEDEISDDKMPELIEYLLEVGAQTERDNVAQAKSERAMADELAESDRLAEEYFNGQG